jgi:hypothetical protein
MMPKTSTEYAELFGLRQAVSNSNIPEEVKEWIEKRIAYLENK